ncbi:MAG: alpha/beta hydrolase family protein [Parabacteroides merdae]
MGTTYRRQEIIEGTKKFCAELALSTLKSRLHRGILRWLHDTIPANKNGYLCRRLSHAGISDITSYWGEGYWGYSYSALASAISYPWNARDMYTLQSPLFNADKINTPILFLHGTVDTNVPVGESIQMFTALKLLGKPTAFSTSSRTKPQILDYKKRAEWNKTIYAWFAKWLKNQPEWWNAMYPEKSL